MKKSIFLFIFFLQYILTYAQPNYRELAKLFIQNGCGGNIHSQELIIPGIKLHLEANDLTELKNELDFETALSSSAVGDLTDIYLKRKANDDFVVGIMQANGKLIRTAISIGTSLGKPTGVGAVIGELINFGTDQLLTKVEKYVENDLIESRTNMVKASLNDIYQNDQSTYQKLKSTLQEGWDPSIQEMDQAKLGTAIDILTGNDGSYTKLRNNLQNEKERQVLDDHMRIRLVEAIKTEAMDRLAADASQNMKITANAKKILKVESRLEEYVQQTTDNFKNLYEAQTEVKNKLDTIIQRTENLENDMKFVKDFMYAKMSPAERLAAARSGVIKLDSTEIRKNEALQAQQAFLQEAKHYLTEASAFTQILGDLDIGGDLGKVLGTATTYANAGLKAFESFEKGNYISAVASITGLMRKRKDADTERFNTLKNMLGTVLRNQKVMQQQLDTLIQGQKKILDNQYKILYSLYELTNTVNKRFDKVEEQLYGIQADVLFNRKLLIHFLAEQNIDAIEDFLYDDGTANNDSVNCIVNTESSAAPPNYLEFKECFDKYYKLNLQKYYSTLRDKFFTINLSNPNSIDIPLVFKAVVNQVSHRDAEKYKSLAYAYELNRWILNHYIEEESSLRSNIIFSLFVPVFQVNEIDKKIDIAYDSSLVQKRPSLKYINASILNSKTVLSDPQLNNSMLLDPGRIDSISALLSDIISLSKFTKDEFSELATFKEVITGSNFNPYMINELEEASFLTEVSLAQQSIIAGDIIIPYMYKTLAKGFVHSNYDQILEPNAFFCLEALDTNAILRTNFFNYYIQRKLRENKRSLASYHFALQSQDSILFSHLFKSTPDTSVHDKPYINFDLKDVDGQQRPIIRLTNSHFLLPNANSIKNAQTIYPDAITLLGTRRSKIIDQIINMKFYNSDVLDTGNQKEINTLLFFALDSP